MTKQRKNSDTQVYAVIFDAILSKQLLPGTRLSEQSLAEMFGVSRTIVRKVLLQLAKDDVLEIEANKGAMVALTTPALAKEYLYARRVLELQTIGLAAIRVSPAQIDYLYWLHEQEMNCDPGQTRGTALRRSCELHFAMASYAGNRPLAEAARRTISRNELIIAQYELKNDPCACTTHDHAGLIAALASADPQRARTLMGAHLDAIEANLVFAHQRSHATPSAYADLRVLQSASNTSISTNAMCFNTAANTNKITRKSNESD